MPRQVQSKQRIGRPSDLIYPPLVLGPVGVLRSACCADAFLNRIWKRECHSSRMRRPRICRDSETVASWTHTPAQGHHLKSSLSYTRVLNPSLLLLLFVFSNSSPLKDAADTLSCEICDAAEYHITGAARLATLGQPIGSLKHRGSHKSNLNGTSGGSSLAGNNTSSFMLKQKPRLVIFELPPKKQCLQNPSS